MKAWRMMTMVPVLAGMLLLGGCGQGGDSSGGAGGTGGTGGTSGGQTSETASAAPAGVTPTEAMQAFQDDGNVAELEIEGDDMMQFNKDRLEAQPGQMVRLTLKHVGNLPAQSMGHNVVILEAGDDPFEFGADVNEQGGTLENNYVSDAVRDRVIAYTEIVGGGETTVVEFRAPQEPGEYPFLCSFPGHAGMMNGVFVVGQ